MTLLAALLGFVAVNGALIALHRRHLRRQREQLGPGRGRVERAPERRFPATSMYASLVHQGDQSFRAVTRLSGAEFRDVRDELRPLIEANRQVRLHVPEPTGRFHPTKLQLEDRLLLGVKFLVCGSSQQDLATQAGLSPAAVSEELRHVIYAIAGGLAYEVSWPDDERRRLLSTLLGPAFREEFGSVDGTWTPTFRKSGDYSGHRHTSLRSHQIACDSLGYIVHIVAGQIGSRHDAWNYQRSELPELLRACGWKLLADAGYEGCGNTLTTPSSVEQFAEPAEREMYLALHTSRRSRVEEFIGLLKALFKLVGKKWEHHDRQFLSVCVLASANLYNRVKRLRANS